MKSNFCVKLKIFIMNLLLLPREQCHNKLYNSTLFIRNRLCLLDYGSKCQFLFYLSSPRLGGQNISSLQTYKIIFEFGPPQLNLFRYITKKVGILWKEAKEKCNLKDGGKPTNGLLLISEDDERTVNDCLKVVGFDVYHLERLLESWFPLLKN